MKIRLQQKLKEKLKAKFEMFEIKYQAQLEDYADGTMNTLLDQCLL